MIDKLLLVAVGGACGAVLRFVSVSTIARMTGESAYGTLLVNVVGSLIMGIIAVLLIERFPDAGAKYLPLITVGLLGGFTTFSAFSLDAVRLVEDGRVIGASMYVLGSVVLSILALVAGLFLGRALI